MSQMGVVNTYATFAGNFTFAEGRLSAEQVQGWDQFCLQLNHPAAPNLWRPLPDGSGVMLLNSESAPWSDWRLVFEWIRHLTERVFIQHGLRLQGEVWYQGEESLDTGRLYANQSGVVARQTIKLCPGVAGAAAQNDVAKLQSVFAEQVATSGAQRQVATQDGFGRTAVMLAALFNSWEVVKELLLHPAWIDWEHGQAKQAEFVGMTAMHYLCNNPSAVAAADQYAEVLAMLPTELPGRILNARDQKGCVPLTLALKTRNRAMVKWLLLHGADPDGIGTALSPYLPIMQAVQLKDVTFLQYLLTAGATVHCRNGASKSPLSLSVEKQHPEHLRLLVLYGANLDAPHVQFRFGSSTTRTVRQVVCDFPAGTSGAVLKPAVASGLAVRRHLVVMILAARVAPDLPRDVVQLVCQYASLTL